ncbi:hypothetical protein [Loktanella salsilacus]|uniref:hypothetical protein n=1 Tax=Loktanella salsilacus TaxID=195913 RepID=UPI0020B87D96|nr:hypothetical protein [Loktanella salsilacus]UTH45332.1 hypothetical protein KBK07_04460 [Loktanella salsilacus]
MLFTFPPEALSCNWVNQTVTEALNLGLDAIDDGGAPLDWPGSLPADKRDVLRRRTGLQPKLIAFWDKYSDLSLADRTCLRDAIARQTNLPLVYSDVALPCPCLNDIPAEIHDAVKALSEYLFGQLGAIKENGKALRDIQFETCQNHGVRICPYCGLDYFLPVGTKRNALDHLMPISKYPFASADFKNLPPTCHSCNSLYKLDQDILFDNAGARRSCSDPYAGPVYQLKLNGSVFGEGNEVQGFIMPRWQINFDGPTAQQAETWDAVYEIKSRLVTTLDADLLSWVRHFASWFIREIGTGKSSDEVAETLPRYIENVIQDHFEDRAFLKAEAFRFLSHSCADPINGNEIKEWLWGFVEYAV